MALVAECTFLISAFMSVLSVSSEGPETQVLERGRGVTRVLTCGPCLQGWKVKYTQDQGI